MCYGSRPVVNLEGGLEWVPNAEFNRLYREGEIVVRKDGYHYAKDDIGVLLWRGPGGGQGGGQGGRNGRVEAAIMRWDLVPRHYLRREDPTLEEALRKKASRAKDPETGRATGFTSYNARIETLASLPSYRDPWKEGLRMVAPASAFKERPNMEGAPREFTGKEYEVILDGTCFLAGIWDAWLNSRGERLESCSIITMDSLGNDKIRSIWHERTPIVLRMDQVEEWLDPRTPPERALALCRLYPADRMEIREVPREAREPRKDPDGMEQTRLDL
jgi:putative SOS response-associated peptidase YedK